MAKDRLRTMTHDAKTPGLWHRKHSRGTNHEYIIAVIHGNGSLTLVYENGRIVNVSDDHFLIHAIHDGQVGWKRIA